MIVMSSCSSCISATVSLKDKRQVVKSVKERIRHDFNAAVAEVGDQELWQRSALGVAVVPRLPSIVMKS